MISKRIHKIIILCLIASVAIVFTAYGTGLRQSRVFEIEAAFLVQFSKYITWPADRFKTEKSPVIIGIIGRDPFGTKIDRIARRFKSGNRPVEIRRIKDDMADADECHILYVTSAETGKMTEIKKNIAGKSIVLVSDTDNFLNQGGIIDFFISGTKIRFNISLTNSRRIGLKISSKLLKVAKRIQ